MKKTILIACTGLLFISLLTQCKKDNTSINTPVNIVLYNQPVSVIKQYIEGKWILHYDLGGLDGKTRHDYVNSYMEFRFGSTDSIIRNVNGIIEIKSPINWFRNRDIFTGDSIYLMGFNIYSTGVPFSYRVSEIKNDTLILADPVADGYVYMLTKH